MQEKPAFRKSINEQRCIIPADGFFEWQKTNGKQPYYIFNFQDLLLNFAGIYAYNPHLALYDDDIEGWIGEGARQVILWLNTSYNLFLLRFIKFRPGSMMQSIILLFA